MTRLRRRVRWLGLPLLGLLLVVALGVDTASAQDVPPGPFPSEDLPQPTQPADPGLPPAPGETPLPDDPMEPIGPPEDPDLFDVPGQINSATHSFFARLVEIGLRIVVALLSATILQTPDLTGNEHIQGMWTAMLVIANLIYVLFIVAGGFVVSARETLQTQYGLKEIVPRIVIAGLASNLSLLVIGQAISVVNALTRAISRNVVPDGAGAALAETWDWAAELTGINIISLLLALVIVLLALVVLVTYIIRIAVMVVLIISAPIVLLFHALPQTEKLAFLWWRALAGCFAIQGAQTITLIAAIGVFLFLFGPTVLGIPVSGHGWLALLVAITMLWLMIKIPVWVKEYLWLNSRGIFRRLLFAYFLYRAATRGHGHHRGGGREQNRGNGGRTGGQRHGPGRPRPGPRPNPRPGGPRSGPANRGNRGTRPGGSTGPGRTRPSPRGGHTTGSSGDDPGSGPVPSAPKGGPGNGPAPAGAGAADLPRPQPTVAVLSRRGEPGGERVGEKLAPVTRRRPEAVPSPAATTRGTTPRGGTVRSRPSTPRPRPGGPGGTGPGRVDRPVRGEAARRPQPSAGGGRPVRPMASSSGRVRGR